MWSVIRANKFEMEWRQADGKYKFMAMRALSSSIMLVITSLAITSQMNNFAITSHAFKETLLNSDLHISPPHPSTNANRRLNNLMITNYFPFFYPSRNNSAALRGSDGNVPLRWVVMSRDLRNISLRLRFVFVIFLGNIKTKLFPRRREMKKLK